MSQHRTEDDRGSSSLWEGTILLGDKQLENTLPLKFSSLFTEEDEELSRLFVHTRSGLLLIVVIVLLLMLLLLLLLLLLMLLLLLLVLLRDCISFHLSSMC